MLARLMARSADCLFLDEPTNDLDIPSQEGLEEVLASYGGAMVVVSHDRYLLRRLAQNVLWIRDGIATMIEGGYDRFEETQHHSLAASPAAAPKEKSAPNAKSASKGKAQRSSAPQRGPQTAARDLAACEREVARLDAERTRLELEFADPAVYDDRDRVARLENELAEVRSAVDAAYARWEELSETAAAG
jgi:ATPase subunit of ABC transporter with duplicated ATPase domains